MIALVAFLLTAAPDCGVNEHASGGHCCRAGEEWVPAKRMCVCLDPDVCGAPKKAAKPVPAPAQKKEEKNGWVAVGEALVQVLEFENMVTAMRNMNSDYPRMTYAEELGKSGKRFTCQQIARLMATGGIDTTNVEIAFHLYPRATDPENFHVLLTGLRSPGTSQFYLKQRLGKE